MGRVMVLLPMLLFTHPATDASLRGRAPPVSQPPSPPLEVGGCIPYESPQPETKEEREVRSARHVNMGPSVVHLPNVPNVHYLGRAADTRADGFAHVHLR